MVSSGRYYFSDVESEVLLLVEGTDEVRFFYALLKSLGIGHIQIASVDGKDHFAPVLKNVLMTSRNYQRLRRLVLVRDADDNAQAAFQSLRSALTGAGLSVPSETFLRWAMGHPSVSIAILPDGESRGNLEDLCLRSLEGSAEYLSVLSCVDQYLDCRGESPDADSGAHSKARLHAYLAVGNRPGRRLGEAADAGAWDWNSPALQLLADFLRQL